MIYFQGSRSETSKPRFCFTLLFSMFFVFIVLSYFECNGRITRNILYFFYFDVM